MQRQQVSSSTQTWIPLLSLSFKINVDTAVGARFSAIVAVARDWKEELVFIGNMKVNTTLILQANAGVIKWVLSLAPVMGNECKTPNFMYSFSMIWSRPLSLFEEQVSVL